MILPAERDARLVTRYRRLVYAMLMLLIVAELFALTDVAPEPISAVWGPHGFGQFFSMALLGTFAMHLLTRPSRRELRATLALALVFELARVALQLWLAWDTRWIILSTGFGAGLASLVVLAFLSRRHPDRRVLLLAGILVPFSVILSNSLVELTTALHPLTLDALVYAFDNSLGFQPSFVLAQLFERFPSLARTAGLIYLATPFGFALLWAAQRRARTPSPIDLMTAFLVASGAGFVLYHAFPVAGPVYVVGDGWPITPPTVATMGLDPGYAQPVARNCMPSLHTTWVLLLLWHSRHRGLVMRAVAAVFFTFTLLATLGLGFHYLVDLVVAFPFAVAVQAASSPSSPWRARAFVSAATAVLVWLVLLRTGALVHSPSLALSWTLVVSTVVMSLLLERRLHRANTLALAADSAPSSVALAAADSAPSSASTAPVERGPWTWLAAGAGVALALLLAPATVSVNLPAALFAFAVGVVAGERLGTGDARAIGGGAALLAVACALTPSLPYAGYAATLATGVLLAGLARRASPPAVLVAALVGAALASLAGDVLVPALGLMRVELLAAAVALSVTVAGLRSKIAPAHDSSAPRAPATETPVAARAFAHLQTALAGAAAWAFVAAYRPLLAFVVGDSVYATAATRAVFAGGAALGLLAVAAVVGARAAGARVATVRATAPALLAGARVATVRATALALLAAALAVGAFGWSPLAHYFASFAAYSISDGFGAREIARFFAAAVAVMPPAAAAAAALATVGSGEYAGATEHDGAARAWAVFAFAGAVATVFVALLLPRLGAWHVAQLATALAALAALVAAARAPRSAASLASVLAPLTIAALAAWAAPSSLAAAHIIGGSHFAFELPPCGDVLADAASVSAIATLAAPPAAPAPAGTDARSCIDGRLLVTPIDGTPIASGEHSFIDGTAAPAGYARVDGTAAPAGYARVDGTAAPAGYARVDNTAAPAGYARVDNTAAPAGYAFVDGIAAPAGYARVDTLVPDAAAAQLLARVQPAGHARAGDALAALRSAPGRYDLVAIARAAPVTPADSALYSRALFTVAAQALSARGRFVAALSLTRISPRALAAIVAGARAAFADVALQLPADELSPATLLGCTAACPRADAPVAGAAHAAPRLDAAALDRFVAAVAERGGLAPDELAADDDAEALAWLLPLAAAKPAAASWHRNLELLSAFAAQ